MRSYIRESSEPDSPHSSPVPSERATTISAFGALKFLRDLIDSLRLLGLSPGEIIELIRMAQALFADFSVDRLLAFLERLLAVAQPVQTQVDAHGYCYTSEAANAKLFALEQLRTAVGDLLLL